MTAIQSGTMADVVTAFDPETYFSYDLHFDLVCSADDSKVILQFSSDGGETWHTSDHKWTWVKCDNTYPASGTPEGLGSNGYGGTDGLYLGRIGNGSGEGMQGRVTLVRPELSTRRRANWEAASSLTNGGGQNERMYVGSGAYTPANSPINAARFVAESGSLTGSWNLSGAEIGTPVGAQEDEQPVATNDTDVATQNTAKPISAAFLLANDTGGNLSLISVGNALNCTVSIVGGDVSFTPVTDFIGTATFDYTISNTVGSAVGTVTVTVSEASIWTNLTGADFANGDTGSFSWSGSTITASANDKNVRTSAGFIPASTDFELEAVYNACGSSAGRGLEIGVADNGSATGQHAPTTSNVVVFSKNSGYNAGHVQSNTEPGVSRSNGHLSGKTWLLKREGSTFKIYIDGILDHTFTSPTSAAALMLWIGAPGAGSGDSLSAVRYRLL